MLNGRSIRVAALVALTAGLVTIAQPAFALSGAPDQTWRTNGKVWALAQTGNSMFVGGTFTRAINPSGQTQVVGNVAAFNITTGAFIPTFLPDVENTVATGKPEVDALAVSSDGSILYIGGSFDTVNGQPRQNFAAVDVATGQQLNPTIVPEPNERVQAIVASPSLVYFGGNFTKVGALDRLHVAAISAVDGSVSTTWIASTAAGTDPCPSQLPPGTSCGPVSNGGSGNVHSLALNPNGGGLFIGGSFFYVDGVPRNSLAQVSTVNGSLITNWRVKWSSIPSEGPGNPYVGPNVVWAILPTATNVYIGYGRTPNGIEKYSMSTSSSIGECASGGCVTTAWTRGTPGNAESLALSPDGTRLFVGGHFGTAVLDFQITSCGSGVWAHGLISLHPSDGTFYCDWFPQVVPFGGQNAPGHGVNPPNFVGGFALQMTPNSLFVGGYFTSISGVVQQGFARFTLVGGPPPPPPVPTITSFAPASGPVGSSVVVTGTGFTGATSVSFGAVSATSFSVDSTTQITAVVPGGFAHAPIKITAPGGTAKSATNFNVTISVISGMTPNNGQVGVQVVISGLGFTGTTQVQFFNGVDAIFSVDSDSQITTTVPGSATTGPVLVTTPSGILQSGTAFTITTPPPPAPTITSFSPPSGPVGTSVVVAGTGFTGATSVNFGALPATSFIVDSDTQITVIVPSGFAHAPIKVTTPGGTVKSAVNFVVT